MTNRTQQMKLLLWACFLVSIAEKTVNAMATKEISAQSAYQLCAPFSKLPTFVDELQFNSQMTPRIDENVLSRFIMGSQDECQTVTKSILKVCKLDESKKKYITLALTSPYFQISIYPTEELNQLINERVGIFSPVSKQLLLRIDKPNNLDQITRHEWRHAAMNTMQEILEGTQTSSVKPYLSGDQEKITIMLEQGDQRALEMSKTLVSETRGKLSTSDKSKLSKLRETFKDKYQESPTSYSMTLSHEQITNLKNQNKFFKIGDIYNFHLPNKEEFLGDLKLIKIIPSSTSQSQDFIFHIQDPLAAVVYEIINQKENIIRLYSKDEYLQERDAYLCQLPDEVLKFFFKEHFNYTNTLITMALERGPALQPNILGYIDIYQFVLNEQLVTLNNPEFFQELHADHFISWAQNAIEVGREDIAYKGLKTLISKGYHVSEANMELAKLEYKNENFKDAATFFRRAKRGGQEFTETEHRQYANTLEKVRPKESQKETKKADRMEAEDTEETKNKRHL